MHGHFQKCMRSYVTVYHNKKLKMAIGRLVGWIRVDDPRNFTDCSFCYIGENNNTK